MIRKSPNRTKPYKGFGRSKKVDAWAKVRAEIKAEFAEMGVTRCEVCGTDGFLGFAHRYKRRHITDDAELRVVALLCVTCHEKVEYGGNMFEDVNAIIERRI